MPLPPTRERPPQLGLDLPNMPGGQPPRKRRRWLRVLGVVVLVLILLAAIAGAASLYFVQHEVNTVLTPKTAQTRAAQKVLAPPLPGKPANILIIGSDHRAGDGTSNARSDTMLIVRLDPQSKTVSMLSIPRDLYIDVPGHGMDKINDTYTIGGPKLTVNTIHELTGLPINFVMSVDFHSFKAIVDQFGGVYMQVDQRYFNDNSAGQDYSAIDIQPGYQLLRGKNALAFSRFRHTDSDFYRIVRQQQMISSLKSRVSGIQIAKNLPALFGILNKYTDMATGGSGKVSSRAVIDYIRLALSLSGNDIYHFELTGDIGVSPGGASIVTASPESIATAVNSFMHPSQRAQQQTADNLIGKGNAASTPKQPVTPVPGDVDVTVLNGNGIGGSAGRTSNVLSSLGYVASVHGEAENHAYVKSEIDYAANNPSAKLAAQALAKQLAQPTLVAVPTTAKPVTTSDTKVALTLIVGSADKTFGAATGALGTKVPGAGGGQLDSNVVQKKTAPTTELDPNFAVSELREILPQIHRLPVLYPAVRDQGSSVDGPARAYRITVGKLKYQAYVIVARMSSGQDYWDFQATTWKNPPLLASPTRTLLHKGIRYQLFFNGTKLHIVAWHENGGTYWISNTLLDKLSNSTMLATAEGARPLPRS